MRRGLAGAALLLLVAVATGAAVLSAAPAGRSQAPGPGLALRDRLLAGGASREAAVREAGFERAVEVLWEAVTAGQEPAATLDDWRDLHRALDALIDIHEAKGDLLKASLYATLQDLQYRNLDEDWPAALAAAERALALQQRSGSEAGLYLKWKAAGEGLLRVGRVEDALRSLRAAQDRLDDPARPLAAILWRTIVQALSRIGDRGAVDAELRRFEAAAEAGPPIYRAQALMARADVQIDRGRHGDAVTTVARARAAVAGDPGAASIEYEVASLLFTCVLASMGTTGYDEALTLSRRVTTEFPGLPIAVEPAAAAAVRVRRRMAGQFDVVLRDDASRLRQCRDAGRVTCQIEAWRSMAATYHAVNATSLRVAALEAAFQLQQGQAPGATPAEQTVTADAALALEASLGWAYVDDGAPFKARRAFESVRSALRAVESASARAALRDRAGEADAGLARVEELDGNLDEARSLLDAQLRPEAGRTGSARIAVLLQRARLERDASRHGEAARFYAETLAEARQHRATARELAVRLERARYLAGLTDADVTDAAAIAAGDLEQSRRLQRVAASSDASWRIAFLEGLLAERRHDVKGAAARYAAAIDALDRVRRELAQQDLREALIDNDAVQELYRRAVAVQLRRDDPAAAWAYLERGRARSFLESLRGRRFGSAPKAGAGANRGDDTGALENQILDLRLQLTPESRPLLRAAGRDPGVLQDDLQRLEGRLTLSRQQSQVMADRRSSPLALSVMSLDQVRAALPPGAALVSFAILPDAIAAWVVTPRQVRVVRSPSAPADVRLRVKRLRQLLADPSSGDELAAVRQEVSDALVGPVARVLPASTTRLVIVPALWMTYLPFEVLARPDGRLLTDAYEVSYLPSASTLAWLRRAQPARTTAPDTLFVGALGHQTIEGWPPLDGTLVEARAIAAIRPGATVASGTAFTRSRVLEALGSFDRVHLATHGLFVDTAPLFSGLLVAGQPGDPTRVTLYDVMDRQIRPRLVVLSACETGLGRLLYGDEVTGLTRTFLIAGADTVVSSLWMVSDESTALLMTRFHARLEAGDGPAAALRAASAEVRAKYPHPAHWAPFVVTGSF